MKIVFPVQKEKLSFLDRAELNYRIVESDGSPEPIMAKVREHIVSIEIEANAVSLIAFGHAMVNFGTIRGIAHQRGAETGTGFEPGSINDEAARLAAHG